MKRTWAQTIAYDLLDSVLVGALAWGTFIIIVVGGILTMVN
jgi:hypothetical protein